jgi:hypothetical protein
MSHSAWAKYSGWAWEVQPHRQAAAGQELKGGDLACLLGAAIGQVGLEDRVITDGEDLVAVLSSSSRAGAAPPGRWRVAASTTPAVSR